MYHTARKGGKKSSPRGCKAMLFPFSLRSSAKEQFSVPVKASQEYTVRKPAGKASNYTPPSSIVSHTFPPTSASIRCTPELQHTWKKQDYQVQLPLPSRLLEDFQRAFFFSFFRHVSHGHFVCVLTDRVMHRMATNKWLHSSSLSNHHSPTQIHTFTCP